MSVKQTLPLVMRMLTVLILWEASTVVVGVLTLVMDSIVHVSEINAKMLLLNFSTNSFNHSGNDAHNS